MDNPSLNDATGGAYLHFYVCHLSHVLVGVWGLSIAIQVFVCTVVWLTKFIPSLDVTNLGCGLHIVLDVWSHDFVGI